MQRGYALCASAALLALATPAAIAQENTPPADVIPFVHDTGYAANIGDDWEVVHSFPVQVDGAAWVRLFFEDIELSGDVFRGTGARLRVTALQDGAVQELNAIHLRQWRNSTCYFNGDSVLVEIVAAPGTGTNRMELREVAAGRAPTPSESQCGTTDDRELSSDPRSARLLPVGCTGWLIDDCSRCFLSAGHCSQLGGGIDVIEFNVPLSNSSGTINHPGPEDQYAIDVTSENWINGGIGNDWSYFGVFANPVTGLTPAQAQGATYEVAPAPDFNPDIDIRITGYGVDSGNRNQVQQTHVGPLAVINNTSIGYVTDTQGGNSGSPVIWEQTGQAIGIHCHGGCTTGGGHNWGSTYQNAGLQGALANPQGVCECGMEMLTTAPAYLAPGETADMQVAVNGATGAPILHVRYDGGAWIDLPMTEGTPEVWQGTLPPPVCGATIEYYFTAPADAGFLTLPAGAPSTTYTALVGAPELFSTNEVESNGGWSVWQSGDSATSGIWKWVDPVGTNVQPEDDHSPDPANRCWVTGQASEGEADDVSDVDGGRTTLFSPVIDISSLSNPLIGYWRWFDGGGAENFTVSISEDGGATWSPLEIVFASDPEASGGWFQTSFLLSAHVDNTDDLRLRFQATDEGDDDIVEAAIDDIEISQLVCSGGGLDCNENGIEDSDDIASGRSTDIDTDGIPDECSTVGTPVCFGDGSGTPCPCSNDSPTAGEGCVSSAGVGMTLTASGSSSITSDDLVMTAGGCPPGNTGLFYVGDSDLSPGVALYDGLQCVGGDVRRFQGLSQSTGTAVDTGFVAQEPSGTYFLPGVTYVFQYWTRDVAGGPSPCGTAANFSPASAVTMTP